MSEAYTAQAATQNVITEAIKALPFERNDNGQYTRSAANQLVTRVKTIMKEQYTTIKNTKDGMEALLDEGTNSMTKIKTTTRGDATMIMNKYNTTDPKPSTEMTRPQAKEEAEELDIAYQAVLGAKKGIIAGITAQVGTDVTDTTLMEADGSTPKSLDDVKLHELMDAVLQNADRVSNKDLRESLLELVNVRVDFRKKITHNVEMIKNKVSNIAALGITFPASMIVTVILAEIENVMDNEWAREFGVPMRKIREKYGYDFVHNDNTLKAVVTELATADNLRDLRAAPAPSGVAYAVAASEYPNSSFWATRNMEDHERDEYETDDEERAYAARSDSESSVEIIKQRKKKKEKETKRSNSRSRRSSSSRRETVRSVNKDCKHCKANRSTSRHPQIPEANCFWNPQWKGFRPKSICNQLEGAEFKARSKFTPELGGYPLSDSD
jgi:hypothetical protein